MIWHFDNSQTYLLGSVHAMRETDNGNSGAINDIYDQVTNVVFEASLDIEENLPIFYEDDKLSNNISKSLFRDVKKAWKKYDLPYSDLEKSRIWSAANSITMGILDRNDFLVQHGVDKFLWTSSHKDNKQVAWLESQSAGLSCFDTSPVEEQQKMLSQPVRNPDKVIEQASAITESWNDGDEEQLISILRSSMDDFPVMFNKLVLERNAIWLDKFITVLDSNVPTLFVVGVLHCVGTQSIQNMLRKRHGLTSRLI